MKDWTKTNYGTPKSWGQVQQERRDEEHDRAIKEGPGEPLAPLMWKLVIAVVVTAASFLTLLYLIFR